MPNASVAHHPWTHLIRASARLCLCALALGLASGCDSIVPRHDLQLVARMFPPSPPVSPEQQQAMLEEVRTRTGVHDFEFSAAEFTPETRLPPGTEWIIQLFIGD